MALFELARGLAAGYNGFNEGVDAEKNRQQADADRKYQAEQRAYQQSQQQRTLEDQRRADEARTALQGVDITKPQPQVLRDVAGIQAKAGNIVEALKTQEAATASAYKQSAERFAQIRAAAPSMTAEQLAKAAADAFNSDYLPAKLNGYQVNPDGSIDIDVASPDGRSLKHRFKDKNELLTGMEAQYSPDTYNAFIKAQREAAIKAQEKLNENPYLNVPAGGMTIDRRTGKVVANNTTGFVPSGQVDADGNPVMVRPTGGARSTGTGVGAAAGKTIDAVKPYIEAFEFSSTKGENKLQEDALARGQSYLPTLAQQGINPQVAALIARDAAVDPTKTELQIDHRTGRVDRIYRNKDVNGGEPVRIAENAGTVEDLVKQAGGKPEVIKKDVETMLSRMVSEAPSEKRQSIMDSYIKLASDPAKRQEFLQSQLNAGKSPEAIKNLERQLSLIGAYVKPQQEVAKSGNANKGESLLSRLRSTGGLFGQQQAMPQTDPNSQAGRAQARQQELRTQKAESERQSAAQKAEREKLTAAEYSADRQAVADGKMTALELAQKWDSRRRELSVKDAADLQNAERQIR